MPDRALRLNMATNPKLPDFPDIPPRKSDKASENAKVQMIKSSKFPWPIVILIVGAALIAAIIAVLPRTPHVGRTPAGAQIPRQPTATQRSEERRVGKEC